MKPSKRIWIVFSLCLTAAAAVMVWLSAAAWRLDQAERETRNRSAQEEKVRLALWRMDSALAPMLSQENARPYIAYQAVFPSAWPGETFGSDGGDPNRLILSPLLREQPPYVLVYFQFDPQGQITSPQLPKNAKLLETIPSDRRTQLQSNLNRVLKLSNRGKFLSLLPKNGSNTHQSDQTVSIESSRLSDAAAGGEKTSSPATTGALVTSQDRESLEKIPSPQEVQKSLKIAAKNEYAQRAEVVQQNRALFQSQNLSNELAYGNNSNVGKVTEPARNDVTKSASEIANKPAEESDSLRSGEKTAMGGMGGRLGKERVMAGPGQAPGSGFGGAAGGGAASRGGASLGGKRSRSATTDSLAQSEKVELDGVERKAKISADTPATTSPLGLEGQPFALDAKSKSNDKGGLVANSAVSRAMPQEKAGIAARQPVASLETTDIPSAPTAMPSVALQMQVPQLNSSKKDSYVLWDTNIWGFDFDAKEISKPDVQGGMMMPLWIEGELFLARRVTAGDHDYIQGCLYDWPALQAWLLDLVSDLFQDAKLQPVEKSLPEQESHRLAAIPALLEPGGGFSAEASSWRPLIVALATAWVCLFIVAAALAALLGGVIRLSERRASFVTAVTHELRTPLTTFQMYAEMLAEGMVPEEENRKKYLITLKNEAFRLTHLVENVLAYARLERGRFDRRREWILLNALINGTRERLTSRAEQAGMSLVMEIAPSTAERNVQVNVAAIEQILFNLVDNACKYAASADDKRICVTVASDDNEATIRVRDFGPGVDASFAGRLFTAFSKTAQEAAHSAPGVGLGLALSQRLARDLGGDLVYENGSPGACFTLKIPKNEG